MKVFDVPFYCGGSWTINQLARNSFKIGIFIKDISEFTEETEKRIYNHFRNNEHFSVGLVENPDEEIVDLIIEIMELDSDQKVVVAVHKPNYTFKYENIEDFKSLEKMVLMYYHSYLEDEVNKQLDLISQMKTDLRAEAREKFRSEYYRKEKIKEVESRSAPEVGSIFGEGSWDRF